MGAKTDIEWADSTWNPVQGCTPISEGCRNCYAKRIAERFRGTKCHPYENGFDPAFFTHKLVHPGQWKHPRKVFVSSMGDLFHEAFHAQVLDQVFAEMLQHDRHTYFVLTKRPERMAEYLQNWLFVAPWVRRFRFDHIWFGVSVENNATIGRIATLTEIPGINRFVSFEPLLEVLERDSCLEAGLSMVHWMICGAETGSGARLMPPEAAHNLCCDAVLMDIPFFFKKWSKGQPDVEMPREFPDFGKDKRR